jgi:hypothetical protein
MRFRLRTLLIVLAVGPMVLWAAWCIYMVRTTHAPPVVKEYLVPVSNGLRFGVEVSP